MRKKITFLSFKEARKVARSLKLPSAKKWLEMTVAEKRQLNIPACPQIYYNNIGWRGWNDFLGLPERFISFKEARAFARSLGLKGSYEWLNSKPHLHRGLRIPYEPQKTYKDKGWDGWEDFLGLPEKAPFMPFEKARAVARTLNIESSYEWMKEKAHFRKIPGIPTTPHIAYKNKGWISWEDFLYFDLKDGLKARGRKND